MNSNAKLEVAKITQQLLEKLILQTPSGEQRNKLTDLNIRLLKLIDNLTKPEIPIDVKIIRDALEGMDTENLKDVVVVYAAYSIYAENELNASRAPKRYLDWMEEKSKENSELGAFIRK